ncbi:MULTISPECIES: anti-repressor SinI family protein [Bacillaceae]|nr:MULTISPECIES: anti-repressor SinI family protein [Bacillaceae]MCE4050764.1 anti-repressor SinI family protein [Bacillus sp. Au-Bac7]MCM3031615.1 anti-repressor SinI family protein [Niallia sp. MER 6]UPO89864.1 anti-repressor SinI family protein [Niallia sp. Man26]
MADTSAELKLDMEWIQLIVEAKELGLTIEQIKEFINQQS